MHYFPLLSLVLTQSPFPPYSHFSNNADLMCLLLDF